MWFRFPEGTSEISVQLQIFHPEAQDKNGRDCFRAPDHFAPLILDLPGFGRGEPVGDLEDLPKDDPQRDLVIEQITAQMEGLKIEISGLRATLAETSVERDEWKLKAMNAEAEISQLKEEAEESEQKSKK